MTLEQLTVFYQRLGANVQRGLTTLRSMAMDLYNKTQEHEKRMDAHDAVHDEISEELGEMQLRLEALTTRVEEVGQALTEIADALGVEEETRPK